MQYSQFGEIRTDTQRVHKLLNSPIKILVASVNPREHMGQKTLVTMLPVPVVPLLLLLLALQRSFAPLDTGVPSEPAVFQFQCNVYFFTTSWFPWFARSQQTAFVIHWMHCLPGHSGALLQFQSDCSDWVDAWYMNHILKSDCCKCLFVPIAMLHWGGVVPTLEICQSIHNWLSWPARLLVEDCWRVSHATPMLGWCMTSWTANDRYILIPDN